MMKYDVKDFNSLHAVLEDFGSELKRLGISDPVAFDCKLVLNELAVNVLRHGGGQAHIRISVEEGVRICVRGDKAFRPPVSVVCADVEKEGGRGLWLVDALSGSREYDEEEGISVLIPLK